MTSSSRSVVSIVMGVLAACSSSGPSVVVSGPRAGAIELSCAAPSGQADAWSCPASVTLSCASPGDVIFSVESPSGARCEASQLTLAPEGPLTAGTHTWWLHDEQGEPLCSSEVTIIGEPGVTVEPKQVQLWPPNHKLHELSVEDCVEVRGGCGLGWEGHFVWVSSDEPVDARGDGHHAPDIAVSDDCGRLSLRSERQGPKDGRVYKVGVRVVDAAGVVHESGCSVSVAHDQSGRPAADSGEAYRVELSDVCESAFDAGP